MNNFRKTLKKNFRIILDIYRKNLGKIVFLSIMVWLFLFIRELPYLNVIPNYHFLVIGIYVVLIVILFRKQIKSVALFFVVELLLITAMLLLLFQSIEIAEFLAFVIFVLVFAATITEGFFSRKSLKEYTENR